MPTIIKEGIEELWNEGKKISEIAEIFGVSSAAMSAIISKMRKEGYDVPSRRLEKKPCEMCGKIYQPKTKKQRFHGRVCVGRYSAGLDNPVISII